MPGYPAAVPASRSLKESSPASHPAPAAHQSPDRSSKVYYPAPDCAANTPASPRASADVQSPLAAMCQSPPKPPAPAPRSDPATAHPIACVSAGYTVPPARSPATRPAGRSAIRRPPDQSRMQKVYRKQSPPDQVPAPRSANSGRTLPGGPDKRSADAAPESAVRNTNSAAVVQITRRCSRARSPIASIMMIPAWSLLGKPSRFTSKRGDFLSTPSVGLAASYFVRTALDAPALQEGTELFRENTYSNFLKELPR